MKRSFSIDAAFDNARFFERRSDLDRAALRRRANLSGEGGQDKFFGPGGQRKSLKRLDPDKEIKANFFAFLWPGLAQFGRIWLNSVLAWIFLGIMRRGIRFRSNAASG